MNIKDMSKPVTSSFLNEQSIRFFGEKIRLDKFSSSDLISTRNKLRNKIKNIEISEGFSAINKDEYQKSRVFLRIIETEIQERRLNKVSKHRKTINEGPEEQAELVMAAKDMVDRITGWMEDTAEMQAESMIDLADSIRNEMGLEMSNSFVSTVKPALESMYKHLESSRESLISGVMLLTGESDGVSMGSDVGDTSMGEPDDQEDTLDTGEGTDISAEPPSDASAPPGDTGAVGSADMSDDFTASKPAEGGAEPAGRARRESRSYAKKRAILEKSRNLGSILLKKK